MEIHCLDKLQSVKDIYQKAEDAIKLIEHMHNHGMVIPAINELRYAGNHILGGLFSQDAGSQEEQFNRAERHCQRAIYDAIEVGILDCFAVFDVFEDDYRLVVKSEICPEYNDIQDQIAVARRFVKEAEKCEKENYYEELQAKYEPLKDAVDKLSRRRKELNIKMALRRRRGMVTVVVLILTLAATLASPYMGTSENSDESILNGCLQGVMSVKPNIKITEAMQTCEKSTDSIKQNGEKQIEEKTEKIKVAPK